LQSELDAVNARLLATCRPKDEFDNLLRQTNEAFAAETGAKVGLRGRLDVANAELLATSGQKVELENHIQKRIAGFAAEIEEKAELPGSLDAAIEGENMLIQAFADCREAVLGAKQEGIHKSGALQESANITADAIQADHQAKIEELRQVLAAETTSQPVAWTLKQLETTLK
jgi:hypothetical protein